MKIVNKKINQTAALIFLLVILFSVFTQIPVYSSDYSAVMDVSSFELIDESTGINVLGTILNKSATADVASYEDPFICTRLSFANVNIYTESQTMIEWDNYYWQAFSLDPKTVRITGERISDGKTIPLENGVYNGDYFLRIDALSAGTTVISVEVSVNPDMSGSITKTFTVRVIDDSNDGDIQAVFQKGVNGENIDLDYELRINMIDTTEILISSVTGYDYSDLNSNFERNLDSYSWSAEVFDITGSITVSFDPESEYSNTAFVSVDKNTGGKKLYIKPLKEGMAEINFTVIPDETGEKKYDPVIYTLKLFISRILGALEFDPVSKIYGMEVPYNEVGIKLENFQIEVNGEKKDIAELVSENNADLTAYITVEREKISENIKTDEENSLWETDLANTAKIKCSIDMSSSFLLDPFIYVPLVSGALVEIEIEGCIYNEYKSAKRWIEVIFVTDNYDGKLASLNFTINGDPVYPGDTFEVEVDKEGSAESFLILENFKAEVYDSKNIASGYKTLINPAEYTILAEAENPDILDIEKGFDSILITPLKQGQTKLSVTAKMTGSGSEIEIPIQIISVNIGISEKEEGKILSIELSRDNEKSKIYTGENRIIYLKNNIDNFKALTINIDKVIISANKPESGYTDELMHYKWDIIQEPSNILSFEKDSGITESGKDTIKIGTEKITGETDNIKITLRITPRTKSYGENGEEVYSIDRSKSLEVSFGIKVNGLGEKFVLEIDYSKEKIYIINSKVGEDKSYYVYTGTPEYMYCLKAVEEGAVQSSEKWFPFMGSSMDISGFIPVSGTIPYRIAVRDADAPRENDGFYSADIRKIIELYPRRTITSAEKKAVLYKNEKIIYKGLESGFENIFYKVGMGEFKKGEINANSGIDVPSRLNPLGNTVTLKFAAFIDRENAENNRFASSEFKIKIPKAGKMPVIKDDQRKKYSGFTNKMLWSTTGEVNSWQNCSRGFVRYENLKLAFPELQKDDEGDFYILYLKTAAKEKTPESNILIVKIPVEKYER